MNEQTTNYKLRNRMLLMIMGVIVGWGVFTFLIYPNITILQSSFFPNGELDLDPMMNVLRSKRAVTAIFNSFILAVSLVITTNILGIFQVFVLDYFEIKGSRWLNMAYYSSLICNGIVLVTAYNFILGPRGFLTANLLQYFPDMNVNWFRGFWAVLAQMTIANTFNHIVLVRSAMKNVDYQTIEAARNMGVKEFRIITKVVLPQLAPALIAASILVFLSGISAFATPEVLGGDFETINPLIMTFSAQIGTRNYAAVLALLLAVITIIILLIFTYIEKHNINISVSKVKTKIKKVKIQNKTANAIVTVMAHIIGLINVLPLLFVILFSFMNINDLLYGVIDFRNLSFDNYIRVFESSQGLQPIFVSIVYSGLAALISVLIMLVLARIITKYNHPLSQLLENLLQIPWYLPATLIALGFVMTFNQPTVFTFGQTLTGTTVILLIVYIILRLPTTLRMIKSGYLSVDYSLEEAAKNVGASTFSTYTKVIIPIIWPTVLSTFLLSFIGMLAEYDATVFVFHPLYQPLGIVLKQTTEPTAPPEQQLLTYVYSVIIMIISAIAIYFVYGRNGRKNKVKA
ncbi:ABC transporter permease [Fundicoccus culcitae]|uniref:Iron ABC transporter permease n=1 Tax=Fundicoccus culcitae TaxID=2969821 RepID=A0ABY5P4G0_9LACT|nr:iron ABC transporter permease [Fundicoccus culcitae]UUX33466.1 iron ABC transporter permease [Fundicoccus culcitae]